jgi:uncharacterized surface protein with fasciclin (FAS1) repeats
LNTGGNTFATLAQQAGIQSQLNNNPSLTVFIPSDSAFNAANLSAGMTAQQLAQTLNGHVVQSTLQNNQVIGYLPNLENGLTLNTTAGTALRITQTVDGDTFVNDAMITKPNIVLMNGVAHVIDKVSHFSCAWPARTRLRS